MGVGGSCWNSEWVRASVEEAGLQQRELKEHILRFSASAYRCVQSHFGHSFIHTVIHAFNTYSLHISMHQTGWYALETHDA